MKNKKLLGTVLLTGALILFTGLILQLCGVIGATLYASGVVRVFYYIFNIIFIVAMLAILLLGICSLFRDNYTMVKLMEGLALVGFVMNFVTVLMFAATASILSVGYAVISVFAFAIVSFSQVVRLCSIFKTFKADVCSLFGCKKLDKKAVKNEAPKHEKQIDDEVEIKE